MQKIVQINGINYGSTGRMMLNVAQEARNSGYEVYTCCRNSKEGKKHIYSNQIYIGTWLDRVISERLSYVFSANGKFNIINTWLFLKELKRINPDIIHLHALCDNFINIPMLFKYIKKHNIKLLWTFHDSWAFTGRCAQFICDGWKTGCTKCDHLDLYPYSLFIDNTKKGWIEKRNIFTSLKDLTIVVPSLYLKGLVEESFFKTKYPIQVINNGIDLSIFRKVNSDFRSKYGIEDKFILLGVAYGWSKPKGLYDFIELAKSLPSNFQIVLVGTNDSVDKELPDNIISIHRTYNQEELVEIYSSCDLFVNPTIDDNFPTVNMEALGCGLPVLTYRTGGSAEVIDETCGASVESGDYENLKKEILRIANDRPFLKKNCIKRAEQHYNMTDKFKEYVSLYHKILNNDQE